MEPCIHFLGDERCELDRPLSSAYCTSQCAAYEPVNTCDSETSLLDSVDEPIHADWFSMMNTVAQ